MYHVVGEVLVQVAEAVWVLAESLVLAPQSVPGGDLAELDEVHHVDGGDVVLPAGQVVPPVALLPETESLHIGVRVTEGRVAVRSSSEVEVPAQWTVLDSGDSGDCGESGVDKGKLDSGLWTTNTSALGLQASPQLGEVRPDDLVSVHENDLLEVEREEDVQEEDLVAPDHPLPLLLLVQPSEHDQHAYDDDKDNGDDDQDNERDDKDDRSDDKGDVDFRQPTSATCSARTRTGIRISWRTPG